MRMMKRPLLLVVAGAAWLLVTGSPRQPAVSAASPRLAQEVGDFGTLAGSGSLRAGVAAVLPETTVMAERLSIEDAETFNAEVRARQAALRAGEPAAIVPPPPAGDDTRPAQFTVETAADPEAVGLETFPAAPNDMTYFVDHPFTAGDVPVTQRSVVNEPTAINLGDTVFYTGNWYAAKSTNGGASFTYVNPYTLFPSVNSGFCCDQVTAYSPAQDMALWGLQYVKDADTGTLRVARALGAAGIAADSWVYWSLTPQLFGFPGGVWFDYPSFTVGATYLYVTSNTFTTSGNSFSGNVVIRIPLAQLAAGGALSMGYFRSNIGTERLTEGAGSTMYWGGFWTTTQMRIHRWADDSDTVYWDNVNLNAFNYLSRNGIATSPDGTNWAARADSRPTAAYVAKGVIGFLWTARQGTGRPYPYVVHARFSEATRALITQADIWSSSYAWMYPSASPNSAGDLAGTMQVGGASSGTFAYPGTQVWITDDVTGASTTVGASHSLSAGNDGPNSNAWGDYFSVRPHKTHTRTWVATSHVLENGGGNSSAVPRYTWFGRERDLEQTAQLTSPTPGSTLPGPSVTFGWSPGSGALGYWLYVGTAGPGSFNVYNASQGTTLSRQVTGLPTNGATVFVRLWTLFATGWQYNDYAYTAFQTVRASLVSPSPGAVLPGTATAFTWSAGAGSSAYWLYVGSSPGGHDVWNRNQGTALTDTVTGIPTDGRRVYVRLWSLVASVWYYSDYSFTAAGTARARLSSPTEGSVLGGSSVTFNWTAGTSSTQYWVYLGTSLGAYNLKNQSMGTALSLVVTGLPTDHRPIYLRLWSRIGTAWVYNDYVFQAFDGGSIRGRMIDPPNGGTLAGSATTFRWAAGSDATRYWLYVGTTGVGSYNLLNEDQVLALSKTVTGLPTNGSVIYVRLWTRRSGAWTYNDYQFKAAP